MNIGVEDIAVVNMVPGGSGVGGHAGEVGMIIIAWTVVTET